MMTNYPDSLLKVNDDWRYSNPKMEVRGQALAILLKRFGSELDENEEPKYSSKSIYECVHDLLLRLSLYLVPLLLVAYMYTSIEIPSLMELNLRLWMQLHHSLVVLVDWLVDLKDFLLGVAH
jgi:hypothetical protein